MFQYQNEENWLWIIICNLEIALLLQRETKIHLLTHDQFFRSRNMWKCAWCNMVTLIDMTNSLTFVILVSNNYHLFVFCSKIQFTVCSCCAITQANIILFYQQNATERWCRHRYDLTGNSVYFSNDVTFEMH